MIKIYELPYICQSTYFFGILFFQNINYLYYINQKPNSFQKQQQIYFKSIHTKQIQQKKVKKQTNERDKSKRNEFLQESSECQKKQRVIIILILFIFNLYQINPLEILGLALGAAVVYPQINSKFDLYHQDTQLNSFIKKKCSEIQKGYFRPTIYLGHGYLQAIFGSQSQFMHDRIIHQKHYIDLGDYGELGYVLSQISQFRIFGFNNYFLKYIDIAKLEDESQIPLEKKQKNKNNVLVILLGITASSTEPYIQNITAEALKEGYTVVLYNDRLYNNYEAKGRVYPKEGYFNTVQDFEKVLTHIRKGYEGYNFYAVGHSFGANTLVKYLGPFLGAVSVANPFDIKQAFIMLNPQFDKYLVQSRQTILQMRESIFKNPPPHIQIDLEKALKAVNTNEFDNVFSRQLHGHKTIEEYYDDLSCKNQLKDVNIPLLCLNSIDDPCVHYSTIPFDIVNFNQHVMLLVTKCGGHVGWFEGFLNPKRWYIKPTLEFLDALSQFSQNQ